MTQQSCRLRIASQIAMLMLMGSVTPAMARIVEVGQIAPSTTTSYGDVWGDGDYAYLGTRDDEGVFIIDISDPASPFVAAQYLPSTGFSPQDIKVQDGIGYFATNGGGGVDIVDLSNPTQPTFITNIACCSGVHNVFIDNGLLTETSSNPSRRGRAGTLMPTV